MNIQEAFEVFREKIDEDNTTWGQDRHKINRYVDFIGKTENAQEAFNGNNIEAFFMKLDSNQSGYYYALKKFHAFLQEDILGLPISKRKIFPLEVPRDKNLEGSSKKPKANYLPKGFNFYVLFNEDFYIHLQNDIASQTIKACIAIGLGAGYNTKDIINMKLSDIQVEEEVVRVKNIYESESVPWIILVGELSDFIKSYYNIRMKNLSPSENTDQYFFRKYWKGSELKVDQDMILMNSNSKKDKPYNINTLMNYMLRYISYKEDIDPHLYPTHLYINTILHHLLQTNGKALESIIRTFGWERGFVRDSFYQYIKYQEQKEFMGFQPFESSLLIEKNNPIPIDSEETNDFFPKSSSDNDFKTDEDILIIELLTKRKRDSKIVRELKKLYRNCCQICGEALVDISGIGYSEVNHIQPLSKHEGPDNKVNMIVLCPNHHTLMDMGIVTIDPRDKETILHVDHNNPLHKSSLTIIKHTFSRENIQYHHDNIYTPMAKRIIISLSKKTTI